MVGCWKNFIGNTGRSLLFSAKAEINLLDEKTLLSLVSSNIYKFGCMFFRGRKEGTKYLLLSSVIQQG